MRYKRILKALNYKAGVENLLQDLRFARSTFPLLGQRPGAMRCLGDNRSTYILVFCNLTSTLRRSLFLLFAGRNVDQITFVQINNWCKVVRIEK